ncbi:MAG: CHAD domain-containing protein [Myxococcales bacterium]|nr:CHAD domain-containing protein [Myxococcales bacterium]
MRLDERVGELRRWLEVARDGLSAESVHEVRVTGRRLRAFLTLGAHHVLVDDLRWLVGSLGRLRDLDVALELPVAASGPFQAWLVAERRAEAENAARLLQHPRVDALVMALGRVPRVSKRRAHRALARLEAKLTVAQETARRDATIDSLHELRKAVRRTRYALEWLGEDEAALQRKQGLVGEACDLNLLERLLLEAGQPAAARCVERALELVVPALAAMR